MAEQYTDVRAEEASSGYMRRLGSRTVHIVAEESKVPGYYVGKCHTIGLRVPVDVVEKGMRLCPTCRRRQSSSSR